MKSDKDTEEIFSLLNRLRFVGWTPLKTQKAAETKF